MLAKNLVLFSLLLPFKDPSAPVSPALSSELHIDVAHAPTELNGGVRSIRLGKVIQRAEGGSATVMHG